eukprot:8823984-Alexandrium_andersonii.AAC.1
MIAVAVMLPMATLMGHFFSETRLGTTVHGMYAFCVESTSLALFALRVLLGMLVNEDVEHRRPAVALDG